MANQWCRLWHEMPNDPKWRTIARVAHQSIPEVQAVYLQLLVSASLNPVKRGVTQCNDEDIASALDMEVSAVAAIRSAMQERVLDGDRLSGWEVRQPKREDDSAERVRNYRESRKYEDVTQCNAVQRNVTLDKDKEERKTKRTNATTSGGATPILSPITVPSWLDADAWAGFVEMRKKMRAPLTARAAQGTFAELGRLRLAGQDPNACLDQSTQRGWRGVFEIKSGYQPSIPTDRPKSAYEVDAELQKSERAALRKAAGA